MCPLKLDGNFDEENIWERQSLNSTGSTLLNKFCYQRVRLNLQNNSIEKKQMFRNVGI